MKRVSMANKAGMVLVICLVLMASVSASLSTLVSRGTKVLAYNDSHVHRFMATEAVKVLPDGSQARQELETIDETDLGSWSGWTYAEWLAFGAYDEDQTDHLYADLTDDMIAIRSIPHYWDADKGPEDPVKDLSGLMDVYPNANQKASGMFQMALDSYRSGELYAAYEYLGHVAHLIGDMFPCHVHEDFHPGYNAELTDVPRWVSTGDEDSWEDDCYEQWIYDSEEYRHYTAESAKIAGGMVTFPDEVIAEGKRRLETDPDGAWKYFLYYLMYTTNQRGDFFASDDCDGDTCDPEGWMEGYWDWPTKYLSPRTAWQLEDNDHGPLGETLWDNDNNDDGDLGIIAGECYVYAIRATATLLQLFWECTHPPEVDLSISYADENGDGASDYRYVSLDIAYVGGDLGYREGLEVRFANGDFSDDPIWGDPGDWRPVGASAGGFRVPWVLPDGNGMKGVRCEIRNLAGHVSVDATYVELVELGLPQTFNYLIEATGAGPEYYTSARVDFYVTGIWAGDVNFYFTAEVDDGNGNMIPYGGQKHQEPSDCWAYEVDSGEWFDVTQVHCDDIALRGCGIICDDTPADYSRVATVYVPPGQTVRLKTHGRDHISWWPDGDLKTVWTPTFTVPSEVGEHWLADGNFETQSNGEVNPFYTLHVHAVATVEESHTWSDFELSDPDNPGWVRYGLDWYHVYTSTLEAPVADTTEWDAVVLDNEAVFCVMDGPELYATAPGKPDTAMAALGPVDLLVTDPDGLRVGTETVIEPVWIPLVGYVDLPVQKTYTEIPRSSVIRQIDWDRDGDLEDFDLDGDGDADTLIVIDWTKDGNYQIQVAPKPGAPTGSTYSIAVSARQMFPRDSFLVESAPVAEMPMEPFWLQSTTDGFILPPKADANGPYSVAEGTAVVFDASDPEETSLTYRWDFESDGTWDTDWSSSPTASHSWYDDWSGEATVEVSSWTRTATSTAAVSVYNQAPIVDSGPDQLATPGQEVQFNGTFGDPGAADTHIIHWDFGDGAEATGTLAPTHVYSQPGQYVVTMTVTDDDGGIGIDTLKVNTGVEVSIDPLQAVVPPGHRFEYEVAIHNLRDVVDTYNLEVGGLEPAWYSLSQTSVTQVAGQTTYVTLEVSPPASASFGICQFAVVASSLTDPAVLDVAEAQAQVGTGEYLGLEVISPPAPTLISPPDGTITNDSAIDFDWSDVTDPSIPINYQVQVDNDDDFSSPEYDSGWIMVSDATVSALSDDTHFWRARASDGLGNVSEWSLVWQFLVDTIPPSVAMVSPPEGGALQDGITFVASVTDTGSGVNSVTFSIRENNGDDGIPIGFEDIPGIYDPATGNWTLWFDTFQLPDGYYVVLVKATDNAGNVGSITVDYSIRNWAVIELLPDTEDNNAGRTLPIKFSLRVCAAVDENQPFVYNEDLRIEIFTADDPDDLMQVSTYGDTAADYRISETEEQYITNFKTDKKAMRYSVAIYRGTFLITSDPDPDAIDSFQFETVDKDKKAATVAAAMAAGLLVVGLPLYFSRRSRRCIGARCPKCGYPADRSHKWGSYSGGEPVCRACRTPLDAL